MRFAQSGNTDWSEDEEADPENVIRHYTIDSAAKTLMIEEDISSI